MNYSSWVLMQDKQDIGKMSSFDPDAISVHLLKYGLILQHRTIQAREDNYVEVSIPIFSDLISFPDDEVELLIQEEKKEYTTDVFLGKPEDRPFKVVPEVWKKLNKGTFIPSSFSVGPKILRIKGISGMVHVIEAFGTKKVISTMKGFVLD
jgi:hypothetical protein